jgi:hypothetical protein
MIIFVAPFRHTWREKAKGRRSSRRPQFSGATKKENHGRTDKPFCHGLIARSDAPYRSLPLADGRKKPLNQKKKLLKEA